MDQQVVQTALFGVLIALGGGKSGVQCWLQARFHLVCLDRALHDWFGGPEMHRSTLHGGYDTSCFENVRECWCVYRYFAKPDFRNYLTRLLPTPTGFGMAIAVGSAMGPAAAILVNGWKLNFDVPIFGTIIVNSMTGPGYFMAIIWTVFTCVVFFTFQEPDRKGLAEQKLLEMKKTELLMQEGDGLMIDRAPSRALDSRREDELSTMLSGVSIKTDFSHREKPWTVQIKECFGHLNASVGLCLGLLFAKTFTIESLVSCTSALTKNRYDWQIQNVGAMGCVNGLMVIPFSIGVGYLSMLYQDRVLMTFLVSIGAFGFFLLIDLTDLRATPSSTYNEGVLFAVGPHRYVVGYFIAYVSIQSFEGVIGSCLSKVIPTALASGTLNSGLLATLVDTLGRASGDIFISIMGFIDLRQLMNFLFIPAFIILITCLIVIRRNYDMLAV
jgi:hypothetical protein